MDKLDKKSMEKLREKLHHLIEKDASYEEIYKASVELDYLIEQYMQTLERAN
ncbi:MAG: aspartyl-phosphate phosphatase Spo0E family protein [bacterium]